MNGHKDNNFYPIALNLDPGVVSLPYEPDVDVRNYIDIGKIMSEHNLGPNGALIMAADMIATKLDEIQDEVYNLNPDFVIADTPGQIELFIFRASGPYFVSNFQSDNKINIFTFDGILASSSNQFHFYCINGDIRKTSIKHIADRCNDKKRSGN